MKIMIKWWWHGLEAFAQSSCDLHSSHYLSQWPVNKINSYRSLKIIGIKEISL